MRPEVIFFLSALRLQTEKIAGTQGSETSVSKTEYENGIVSLGVKLLLKAVSSHTAPVYHIFVLVISFESFKFGREKRQLLATVLGPAMLYVAASISACFLVLGNKRPQWEVAPEGWQEKIRRELKEIKTKIDDLHYGLKCANTSTCGSTPTETGLSILT